ncbi:MULTISPECIES: LolA family protein [Myroides]|uniref:LolA family protein n=1 Tax=Myroides TaxID=76831 RepID=UPI00132683E0|nr:MULTISPECIES: outer membrane lipoprotein carrier protein LolA [Myroides]MVX37205.1 outer membrane lipoprotein carrier protein LolA [Myroides sp. LoEW2-1]UVD78992.1 outer membrane lipoprotein carrier protein LolA [Myroides albus]
MKKLISLLFIIAISLSNTYGQSSQRAKNYLNEVSKRLSNYKNVSIDFSYSSRNDKDEQLNQDTKGHVDIQGDLYLLEFMGIKKIYDGKKIYTISSEDEEVTISKFNKEKSDGILPSHLLTFFQEGFTYQWDILASVKGRQIQYIKLFPIDESSSIKEVLLGIDDQSKDIYTKVQTNKNGTKTILTVNSFKTNQSISKNHFTFTESQYPNYYINKID